MAQYRYLVYDIKLQMRLVNLEFIYMCLSVQCISDVITCYFTKSIDPLKRYNNNDCHALKYFKVFML